MRISEVLHVLSDEEDGINIIPLDDERHVTIQVGIADHPLVAMFKLSVKKTLVMDLLKDEYIELFFSMGLPSVLLHQFGFDSERQAVGTIYISEDPRKEALLSFYYEANAQRIEADDSRLRDDS